MIKTIEIPTSLYYKKKFIQKKFIDNVIKHNSDADIEIYSPNVITEFFSCLLIEDAVKKNFKYFTFRIDEDTKQYNYTQNENVDIKTIKIINEIIDKLHKNYYLGVNCSFHTNYHYIASYPYDSPLTHQIFDEIFNTRNIFDNNHSVQFSNHVLSVNANKDPIVEQQKQLIDHNFDPIRMIDSFLVIFGQVYSMYSIRELDYLFTKSNIDQLISVIGGNARIELYRNLNNGLHLK